MFRDRDDAARQLCGELKAYGGPDTVVVGLARGGVVLADRIARTLGARLGVLIVRKLGAPFNPELAIGAICDGADPHVYLNKRLIADLGISDDLVRAEIEAQAKELRRREAAYAQHLPAPELRGKSVIITDDGIATGATMRVAIEAVRRAEPRQCVLAVPVASPRALEELAPMVDRLICPHSPEFFYAVGQFYSRFTQVTDEDVIEMLKDFNEQVASLAQRRQASGPDQEQDQ